MALITRRRVIGSGLVTAGLVAAPAIPRAADDTMVSKGIYWKRVPCQKEHVYSKHLVPDRWFLELYAPPEQSWSVAYADGTTLTGAPYGNGDTKSARPEMNGAVGCMVVSKDLGGGTNDKTLDILNRWPPKNFYGPLHLLGPGRFGFSANFIFPAGAQGSGAIWIAIWVKGPEGQFPLTPAGWPYAAVPADPKDDF
ncbi:MAG TPA: hypothetical protein VKB68_10345 [Stellaceae bacterium]|nr:hypothetical protein [Stellaceae bacterium]